MTRHLSRKVKSLLSFSSLFALQPYKPNKRHIHTLCRPKSVTRFCVNNDMSFLLDSLSSVKFDDVNDIVYVVV